MIADPVTFAASFNREPFGFEHTLGTLDLFARDNLERLALRYSSAPNDFFVASSAAAPDTTFYAVENGHYTPAEALAALDTTAQRILLKRPERYDPRFADLQDMLFDTFIDPRGEVRPTLERLASSIFISSAAAITPFHFDPEITFFFQITGAKVYHLYSPTSVREPELEAFYRRGVLNIGQIDLAGRAVAKEIVYALSAGKGLHQPQNSPHWVETRDQQSISYAISFETAATRAAGRTRAFNHYLRRLGGSPATPGADPVHDARKARAWQLAKSGKTLLRRSFPGKAAELQYGNNGGRRLALPSAAIDSTNTGQIGIESDV